VTRSRVVATGFYGMNNFGDDLFRHVARRNADVLWPGKSLTFSAPEPNGSQGPSLYARTYARSSTAGSAVRLLHAANDVRRGDLISYCGGSILNSVRGTRYVHRAGSALGLTKFEALGVSIGPLSTVRDEQNVADFLRQFARIIVRDRASAAWLRVQGIPGQFGGDLAGLLSPAQELVPSREQPPRVVISPCSTRGAYTPEYEKGVVAATRDLVVALGEGCTIDVLALNSHPQHGDLQVAQRLASMLGHVAPVRILNYEEVGLEGCVSVITTSSVVLATRLHAAIVAYLMGVPAILTTYHRKCGDFAADVGIPASLVLAPKAGVDMWLTAAASVRAAAPAMPASSYRARAYAAYAGDADR
jgi:polysaccharide pyruvyl transferase WcaK-like protein